MIMNNEEYYIKKYEINEWSKCYSDPKYFINNHIYNYYPVPQHSNKAGRRKFKMYSGQETIIDYYQNHSRLVGNLSRQTGFTTITLSYILWHCMFKPEKAIIISGQTAAQTFDLKARFMDIYSSQSDFLKIKTTTNNKNEVIFENGASIIAVPATSLTNSAKGRSLSLVYIDCAAYHKQKTLSDFLNYTVPPAMTPSSKIIVASSPTSKLTEFYNLWKFSTRNGIGNIGPNGYFPFQMTWDQNPMITDDVKDQIINAIGDTAWASEYNCQFI